MKAKLAIAALLAASIGAPAWATDSTWGGFRFGLHGGAAQLDVASEADQGFCYTRTQTAGAGQASATCALTANGGVRLEAQADASGGGPPGGAEAIALLQSNPATPAISGAAAARADLDADSNTATGAQSAAAPAAANGAGGEQARATAAGVLLDGATSGGVFTSTQDGANLASAAAIGFTSFFSSNEDAARSSLALGGHVGYDRQSAGGVVFGVELDLTATPNGESEIVRSASRQGVAGDQFTSVETVFLSSARLRVGYAADDLLGSGWDALFYATAGGGLARFNVEARQTIDIPATTVSTNTLGGGVQSSGGKTDAWAFGPVVGAGASLKMRDGVILSGEALYYVFDEEVDGSKFGASGGSVRFGDVIETRVKISFMLN